MSSKGLGLARLVAIFNKVLDLGLRSSLTST